MIQRIQTLFLIIAAVLAVVFLFVPFGYATAVDASTGVAALEPLKGCGYYGLIAAVAVAVALTVCGIFTYRNYRLQKLYTLGGILAIIAGIGVTVYALVTPYVDTDPAVNVSVVWGGGGLLLVAALIAAIAAYHYIRKDEKLIRSYDRLR